MINKVSHCSFTAGVKNYSSIEKQKVKKPIGSKKTQYADSFLKNAKETAPILLALTGLWSLLDFGSGKTTMAKSLKNNLTYFFAPILIFSSAIVSLIENKKPSKSSKQ